MRVKAIMMPFSKLACISVENTVEEAMKIIDEQGIFPELYRDQRRICTAKSDGVHEDKN